MGKPRAVCLNLTSDTYFLSLSDFSHVGPCAVGSTEVMSYLDLSGIVRRNTWSQAWQEQITHKSTFRVNQRMDISGDVKKNLSWGL